METFLNLGTVPRKIDSVWSLTTHDCTVRSRARPARLLTSGGSYQRGKLNETVGSLTENAALLRQRRALAFNQRLHPLHERLGLHGALVLLLARTRTFTSPASISLSPTTSQRAGDRRSTIYLYCRTADPVHHGPRIKDASLKVRAPPSGRLRTFPSNRPYRRRRP